MPMPKSALPCLIPPFETQKKKNNNNNNKSTRSPPPLDLNPKKSKIKIFSLAGKEKPLVIQAL
jgi:hypothetical protein